MPDKLCERGGSEAHGEDYHQALSSRSPTAQYFKQIRTWEGRQTRAFEELCFQLRDPEPDGVDLRKTSDPDGGLEWYGVDCVGERNGGPR